MRLLEDHRRPIESLYRDWEFNGVVVQAAQRGDLTSLIWLAETYMPHGTLSSAASAAAASGQLQVLKWLLEEHQSRVHWGGMEWCEAIHEEQSAVIEWLRQHSIPDEDAVWRLIHDAADKGDLELVKWLLSLHGAAISAALRGAYKGHRCHILKWLATHCDPLPRTDCVDAAAKDGDLEFLQWIHANNLVDSLSGAVSISAASGHLSVLKWLYEEVGEQELTADCMDQAASAGHLDVVKWLDYHECPATTLAMDGAAAAGFLDVVKWLHGQRTEGCSVSAINGAAENGYFEIAKWLHSNRDEGCDVSAMEKAAGNGNLEIVQWLHSHRNEGCTERAMDWAAKGGHLEVVKWLHLNRSEGCTTAAMDWAAYGGHLETIKWLDGNRSEGYTAKALCFAAAGGRLDVLKWLHSTKSERLTSDTVDMAAAGGHLQVLEWLHVHGVEECSPSAMRDAVLGHHIPVILFLFEKYRDICEEGVCFLRDEWGDLEVRFVGLARWLLEQFGGALEGASFSVNRADWATNKWMSEHMQHLDVEDKFVYWECGPWYS
ncbi:Ankyrin repeats (many copies) [Phytophthora infestans]|uniref:Ankyrin repeats (Many copies) n=1 Tax=Phytophthora infestans TaxID=4787 RepID=A0A8S9V2V5_PHYIN|nr:Ankyrin repeats (many copies) [Phytophthora infestans]